MTRERVGDPPGATTLSDSDPGELHDFLDRHFDGRGGLASEYPTLIGADNGRRCWVIRDRSGQICSHAAWRPLEMRSHTEHFTAAGIGLVTTAADARGRGFAGRLVEHCIAQARESRCDLAVLFARPRPLYTRAGFVPAGRERVTRLEGDRGGDDKVVSVAGPRDAFRLAPLLERHPVRVQRSVADFERLLAIPHTRLYTRERDGHPLAYCIEGKGRDLQGVIHEWAGDPGAVAELFRGLAAGIASPLAVLSPAETPPPFDGDAEIGTLAMIKILRAERFGGTDPREVFGDTTRPARVPVYVWGLDSV